MCGCRTGIFRGIDSPQLKEDKAYDVLFCFSCLDCRGCLSCSLTMLLGPKRLNLKYDQLNSLIAVKLESHSGATRLYSPAERQTVQYKAAITPRSILWPPLHFLITNWLIRHANVLEGNTHFLFVRNVFKWSHALHFTVQLFESFS